MTLLIWKPEYAIGIAAVDYEHQELIRMINDLDRRIQGPIAAGEIESFLGELHAAISAHFALEELAMVKAHYAELPQHKADHEALLEQIREMMDQFVAGPDQGRRLLGERLENWFEKHFSTFDARLHQVTNSGSE